MRYKGCHNWDSGVLLEGSHRFNWGCRESSGGATVNWGANRWGKTGASQTTRPLKGARGGLGRAVGGQCRAGEGQTGYFGVKVKSSTRALNQLNSPSDEQFL